MDGLQLPEPVAVTLVRRGYRTVEEARAFLEASETHDPFAFDSMGDVKAMVEQAVADGRTITVHGDYDCDGVCGDRDPGAGPARSSRHGATGTSRIAWGTGYGLTRDGVERLAARGTGLLITADCGITCADEVEAAHAAGMEVIVTDHHEPGPSLPDCPIVHPRLGGYPFGELCAAGVAHKLAAALLGTEEAERDLDLVALATVADLVPLRGENRALVRSGARGCSAGHAAGAPGALRVRLDRPRAPRRGRPRVPARAADQRRRSALPRRRRRRADADLR